MVVIVVNLFVPFCACLIRFVHCVTGVIFKLPILSEFMYPMFIRITDILGTYCTFCSFSTYVLARNEERREKASAQALHTRTTPERSAICGLY